MGPMETLMNLNKKIWLTLSYHTIPHIPAGESDWILLENGMPYWSYIKVFSTGVLYAKLHRRHCDTIAEMGLSVTQQHKEQKKQQQDHSFIKV